MCLDHCNYLCVILFSIVIILFWVPRRVYQCYLTIAHNRVRGMSQAFVIKLLNVHLRSEFLFMKLFYDIVAFVIPFVDPAKHIICFNEFLLLHYVQCLTALITCAAVQEILFFTV